mmetsp:Transcript_4682/g.9345  ORF Transcript_4682/g.9345 Transcript_4682/m.9345 type:complete len:489 (-) Transcript_4682:561-2027(-)
MPLNRGGNGLLEGERDENSLQCVFWEVLTRTWSTAGCSTELGLDRSTAAALPTATCVCSHLTEFAIMAQHQETSSEADSQPLTTVLEIAYLTSVGVSGLMFGITFWRTLVLFKIRKHRTWVSFTHIMLSAQLVSRLLSSLLFSGIIEGVSLSESHDAVVVVVVALPYTFIFWTGSVTIFQWMSMYFKDTEIDPFKETKIIYYSINTFLVFIVWILLAVLWILHVTYAALIGSALLSAVCITMYMSYITMGLKMRKRMMKVFGRIRAGRDSIHQSRRMKEAERMLTIALVVSGGFPVLSITFILSAVLPQYLDFFVPAHLLSEAFFACAILWTYRKGYASLTRSVASSYETRSGGRMSYSRRELSRFGRGGRSLQAVSGSSTPNNHKHHRRRFSRSPSALYGNVPRVDSHTSAAFSLQASFLKPHSRQASVTRPHTRSHFRQASFTKPQRADEEKKGLQGRGTNPMNRSYSNVLMLESPVQHLHKHPYE